MKNSRKLFSLKNIYASFGHAVCGILVLIVNEPNAKIHLTISIIVVFTGIWLKLSAIEWCFIIFSITIVWVSEAINTAFESLCDVVSPDFHPAVKKSKDIAAGAVLLSAIASTVVGLVIFIPHLLT